MVLDLAEKWDIVLINLDHLLLSSWEVLSFQGNFLSVGRGTAFLGRLNFVGVCLFYFLFLFFLQIKVKVELEVIAVFIFFENLLKSLTICLSLFLFVLQALMHNEFMGQNFCPERNTSEVSRCKNFVM